MVNIFRQISPYPTVDQEGVFMDGFLLPQPKICLRCKSKKCPTAVPKEFSDSVIHSVCPQGISLFAVKFDTEVILINGVIESLLNKDCPSVIRKEYRSHKVTMEHVKRWWQVISKIREDIELLTNRRVAEAIGGLHDIKTATSLVFRNAEAYIGQLSGENDDEKIENSPDSLKSLFKSISLLNTRLTMSSIVSNPESASFGRKRLAPIYKIFDRMCRLFEEIGAKKGIHIIMGGSSFNKVKCYDSFETLALVLVDNAVKYSLPGEPVTVKAMDSGTGVEVSIESRGPVVAEGDRLKIFERGIRTIAAKEMVQGGSGLGLFIARTVAEAHNTKIIYQAKNISAKNDIGTNVFSFYIE